MNIRLSDTFIAVDDHDAALIFYRDVLGLEVRNDVGFEGMRWITVGAASRPDVNIVLEPPFADPDASPADKRTMAELMAKGLLRGVIFATDDCDATFERRQHRRRRSTTRTHGPALRGARLRLPRPGWQPIAFHSTAERINAGPGRGGRLTRPPRTMRKAHPLPVRLARKRVRTAAITLTAVIHIGQIGHQNPFHHRGSIVAEATVGFVSSPPR